MPESRTFVTSDHHFNHAKIIEYCARPFENTHFMNKEMTRLWNETVGPLDVVYHLGDFGFNNRGLAQLNDILKHLNGKRFILIRGNHDRSAESMHQIGFHEVHKSVVLHVGKHHIFMNHRPTSTREWTPGSTMHLCGHVHEAWKYSPLDRALNVGVDVWGFKPVLLSDAIAEWEREAEARR